MCTNVLRAYPVHHIRSRVLRRGHGRGTATAATLENHEVAEIFADVVAEILAEI